MTPSAYHNAVLTGIARALFARAWIDFQEEFDTGAVDNDSPWCDMLPSDNDPAAYRMAETIMAEIPALNDGQSAVRLYCRYSYDVFDPTLFGHLIGMQAMGPHSPLRALDIPVAVPSVEFHWIDLDGDYFPAMDQSLSDDIDVLAQDGLLDAIVMAMPRPVTPLVIGA